MTESEAVAYIENYTWSSTKLGLERTRALLSAVGDPQKKLKFVHVTGSNGKGSTCAMLDAVLRSAGYRVGLYTSPYIQDFCERMRVDGENIPGEKLAAITGRVRVPADAMADHPSQFELVTAIAMLYFLEERCDIVVLEVGMGGALDSTNAIDAPEAAVFTNIGLEHTEYLGSTLEEIALTKAGIVKPGCNVVCYDGAIEATETIRAVCAEKKVPFRLVDRSGLVPLRHDLTGQQFRYGGKTFFLPLLGEHQLHNAATALETIAVLRERGWQIGEEAVRRGLEGVRWPARFEVMSRDPLFILDGGHNPQCAQAISDILSGYLPGERIVFLMGVLADKDYRAMLGILSPHADFFVCVTPESPRALPAAALAEEVQKRGVPAVSHDTIEGGIHAALERGRPVVACGSLYMAGHIRTAFPECVGRPS